MAEYRVTSAKSLCILIPIHRRLIMNDPKPPVPIPDPNDPQAP